MKVIEMEKKVLILFVFSFAGVLQSFGFGLGT